jgi:ABC-type lipoprotein release transport system permease subunit
MKGCGISIVGIVLGSIVALWMIFHIGTIFRFISSIFGVK